MLDPSNTEMKDISRLVKVNIHIHLGQEGCIQYVEIHCGKVTGCGKVGPSTLGFGSFAGARLPSSMVSKKSLLKWPSVIFQTFTQDSEPMSLAASPQSFAMSNLT